jgi:tetratricopeptide (TPR) repeat protein
MKAPVVAASAFAVGLLCSGTAVARTQASAPSPNVPSAKRSPSTEGYFNRGAALQEKDDSDCAIREYREALRLDPNFAEEHNNLGNAVRERSDFKSSITEPREALRLKPDFAVAHSNLGIPRTSSLGRSRLAFTLIWCRCCLAAIIKAFAMRGQ